MKSESCAVILQAALSVKAGTATNMTNLTWNCSGFFPLQDVTVGFQETNKFVTLRETLYLTISEYASCLSMLKR